MLAKAATVFRWAAQISYLSDTKAMIPFITCIGFTTNNKVLWYTDLTIMSQTKIWKINSQKHEDHCGATTRTWVANQTNLMAVTVLVSALPVSSLMKMTEMQTYFSVS